MDAENAGNGNEDHSPELGTSTSKLNIPMRCSSGSTESTIQHSDADSTQASGRCAQFTVFE